MKKKKRSNINLSIMQEFVAILKDNGVNTPSMFEQKNTFTTDDPINLTRSNTGYYQLAGFTLDDEGLLDKEKTEIYFGNGNDKYAARWAKLETDFSYPAQIVNIFTEEAGMDGTFTPADGLLSYITIKIVRNP